MDMGAGPCEALAHDTSERGARGGGGRELWERGLEDRKRGVPTAQRAPWRVPPTLQARGRRPGPRTRPPLLIRSARRHPHHHPPPASSPRLVLTPDPYPAFPYTVATRLY